MRVRAIRRGYYAATLYRPGDVFTLACAEDFSSRWMAPVPAATDERHTSAQAALDSTCVDGSPLGRTRRVAEAVDPDADRDVDFDFNPFTPREESES